LGHDCEGLERGRTRPGRNGVLLLRRANRYQGGACSEEKPRSRHYADLAAKIRAAFNQTFYSRNTHQYEKGTQFSNAFPLFLGLTDPAEKTLVLGNIMSDLEAKNGHFDVGVLGAKYLIEALSDHGKPGHAFALATQTVIQAGHICWRGVARLCPSSGTCTGRTTTS